MTITDTAIFLYLIIIIPPHTVSGSNTTQEDNPTHKIVRCSPPHSFKTKQRLDERRIRLLPYSIRLFPRKEVIQPHLPVRLPCYDFTPIADPTFDSCLPKGLAHRLRVLPTFVV